MIAHSRRVVCPVPYAVTANSLSNIQYDPPVLAFNVSPDGRLYDPNGPAKEFKEAMPMFSFRNNVGNAFASGTSSQRHGYTEVRACHQKYNPIATHDRVQFEGVVIDSMPRVNTDDDRPGRTEAYEILSLQKGGVVRVEVLPHQMGILSIPKYGDNVFFCVKRQGALGGGAPFAPVLVCDDGNNDIPAQNIIGTVHYVHQWDNTKKNIIEVRLNGKNASMPYQGPIGAGRIFLSPFIDEENGQADETDPAEIEDSAEQRAKDAIEGAKKMIRELREEKAAVEAAEAAAEATADVSGAAVDEESEHENPDGAMMAAMIDESKLESPKKKKKPKTSRKRRGVHDPDFP